MNTSKKVEKSVSRESSGFAIIAYFLKQHGIAAAILFIGMLATGFTEGLGIMTLVLAIEIVTGDIATVENELILSIVGVLQYLGIGTALGPVLSITIVIILLKTLLHFAVMSYGEYVAEELGLQARRDLVSATMTANYRFVTNYQIGRFSYALSNQTTSVSALFILMCRGSALLVNITAYFVVAYSLSWQLSLAAVIASIFMIRAFYWLVNVSRKTGIATTILYNSFVSRVTDGLQGIKTLKSMGMEIFLGPHLEREIVELRKQQLKQKIAKLMLIESREPFVVLIVGVGIFVAVSYMGMEISLILGMALVFHRTINGVGRLQSIYQRAVGLKPLYESFTELLHDAQHSRETFTPSSEKMRLKEVLKLDRVCFHYDEETEIIDEVSIDMPAGSITALRGPSGSGKTTILDLICGLYFPTKGNIFVDGLMLGQHNVQNWRSRIGYVPQDSVLFHDSIFTNITLGDPRLQFEDVKIALEKTNAWEFVNELSDGVDAVIGDEGLTFSGGEKQRLSLARALVRNPDLLILDEATAALDAENELAIIEVLEALKGSTTILAVSHQEATVTVADNVYDIRSGRAKLVDVN